MAPVPLPGDFRLRFAPELRRPAPEVLIGGAPLRVLRLTPAGASLVERWMSGEPVGAGRAAGVLAARLVEAGVAAPCPPALGAGGARGGRLAPGLAVVVPVRDDPAGLRATLAALGDTAPGVQVTVVDDGSDPPVALPRAATGAAAVSLVRRPVAGGPAAARNTGIEQVAGETEVVAFVDAGCVPEPGWLAALLPHFCDPGVVAVAPRVRSRASPGTPSALARYEARHSPLDLGPDGGPVRPGAPVPYVPTAVLLARVAAVRAAGGFDEDMRFGEDVDLVWRLHERGGRLRYEPAAAATHPARPDLRRWLRQRFDYGRSATPLAARHGRAVAPSTVSPWSVAAWALLCVGRPLPAVVMAAGSAEALALRAAGSPEVARELRRLAYAGNARGGGAIASTIRRAWLPPALASAALVWSRSGRRARRSLVGTAVAVFVVPALSDWLRARRRGAGPGTPGMRESGLGLGSPGPLAWMCLRLADDLAYQAGVWAGAVEGRSARALLPRW